MSGRSFSFWGGTLENTERNANILHRHLCSRDIFYASFLLLRQFGQKRITGYKICPGVHDLLLKFVKRIEANYISPPDKFSGNRQHRIGVAMRRNTKECQQKFDCWIIKEKMLYCRYGKSIEPKAALPFLFFRRVSSSPPDEKKRRAMQYTLHIRI